MKKIRRRYFIYKKKSNSTLEPMGTYYGTDPVDVLREMGNSGNIYGEEWQAQYVVVPEYYHHAPLKIPT